MLLTRTYGEFTATFIRLESNRCFSSVLAEYRDTDFIHIREDGIESVSKNFIPVLFKIELHLQQFHSGDYHFKIQTQPMLLSKRVGSDIQFLNRPKIDLR